MISNKKYNTTEKFKARVESIDRSLLKIDKLKTLQVNLGNICNLSCTHCHVQASPDGKNIMPASIMDRIVDFLKKRKDLTVDMTGGCPELNPDFRYFLEKVSPLADKLIARTNLSILTEPSAENIPLLYKKHHVIIVGSMPCYTERNVNEQRGNGVFAKNIKAIKLLNSIGYGIDENLELNLVYNPSADFLPASQEKLQADYKAHLFDEHGLKFNRLFTITNAPIGRFESYLRANGKFSQYLQLLEDNFNEAAARNIMCRSLVSIDYRGFVYNCDFNQALGMPIIDRYGKMVTIKNLDDALKDSPEIITESHCFCCTAGAGSSCTGSLTK